MQCQISCCRWQCSTHVQQYMPCLAAGRGACGVRSCGQVRQRKHGRPTAWNCSDQSLLCDALPLQTATAMKCPMAVPNAHSALHVLHMPGCWQERIWCEKLQSGQAVQAWKPNCLALTRPVPFLILFSFLPTAIALQRPNSCCQWQCSMHVQHYMPCLAAGSRRKCEKLRSGQAVQA